MLQHYGEGQGDTNFHGFNTSFIIFCSFPNVIAPCNEKNHQQPPFFGKGNFALSVGEQKHENITWMHLNKTEIKRKLTENRMDFK